jgi:heme oxygenase
MRPPHVQETTALKLKHHTAGPHAALEAIVLPRLQSICTIQDYISLLQSFYGFFKPVEKLIEMHVDEAVLPDIKSRRKAALLLQDLTFSNAHTSAIPLATQLPQVANLPAALGVLYVLEGSTLGGRSITKLLLKNEALCLQPGQVRFFNGYGADTGPMWMAFLETLNKYGEDEAAQEQMIVAANETFSYFKNWLQTP